MRHHDHIGVHNVIMRVKQAVQGVHEQRHAVIHVRAAFAMREAIEKCAKFMPGLLAVCHFLCHLQVSKIHFPQPRLFSHLRQQRQW